jgi:16S rRNA (adenine1518-N6/adenine1519-N6)-dimethyltransferase
MTLTEIRQLLDKWEVRPSRRLGQNFLHDQNVAQKIVELGEIKPEDPVLEIGPGLGAITEFIEQQSKNLSLIEKDLRLAEFLSERFPKVPMVVGDAMEEISHFRFKISDHLVIGNLPYSVASPIMIRLCEFDLRPQKMVFTIQLEVAERLVANPQTKDYGVLTLLTRPYYDIKIARKISQTVFWPQPDVGSAVVTFQRRPISEMPDAETELRFRTLIKLAFQKRRKTLQAIFKGSFANIPQGTQRPEELSIEDWLSLARSDVAKEVVEEIFDVVDQNDEVIGQERRSEVHKQKLLHRAVHIFIWNKKGEILLQRRSAFKDVSPNTWDSSAAGHLCSGELYDQAAQREIQEELNIQVPLRKLEKLNVCEALGWEFVWVYDGHSEGPFHFPEREISEVKWWSIEETDRAISEHPEQFARSFRHIWSKLDRSKIKAGESPRKS